MNNKLEVIGIDHGWSMMKTISQVFVTGVKEITTTPALFGDVLEYEGKFYKVGTVRQEVKDTKVEDDSFYLLTLAAVAKELKRRGLAEAKVFLAVGLPLTRFGAEKNDFIKYLTKNKRVSFKYENESYHIEIDVKLSFSFFVVNCENIPFKKEFFDAIIANHVLFYLNDLNQGLSEIKRVLKKNGVFYSTTYSKNHMREINELVKEFNSNVYLSEQPLYHRFGLENGEMLLKQYFKNVECKIYNDYLDIDNAKPIVNYILSCHGNQDILLEKYDEFYDFVENKIKEKGFIRITKEACLFICENR